MDFDCFVCMCNIHGFVSFMLMLFGLLYIYCSSFYGDVGPNCCEFFLLFRYGSAGIGNFVSEFLVRSRLQDVSFETFEREF